MHYNILFAETSLRIKTNSHIGFPSLRLLKMLVDSFLYSTGFRWCARPRSVFFIHLFSAALQAHRKGWQDARAVPAVGLHRRPAIRGKVQRVRPAGAERGGRLCHRAHGENGRLWQSKQIGGGAAFLPERRRLYRQSRHNLASKGSLSTEDGFGWDENFREEPTKILTTGISRRVFWLTQYLKRVLI